MEFKRTPRPSRPQPDPAGEAPSDAQKSPPAETETSSRSPHILNETRAYIQTHQSALVIGVIGAVVIVLLATTILQRQSPPPTDSNKTDQATASKDLNQKTLTPAGTSIDSKGGWSRISPPGKTPVFAYSDAINGTPISVSQQPIPESFKTNASGGIAELARSYNATATVQAGDTTVYIGDSARGPQSVIFTKGNLLIMIKSQQKIAADAWVRYITSLK